VAAAVVVLTGALPGEDAVALAARVGPVLAFVAALTVVAELCGSAGLFDVATDVAARSAGGRRWVLWLLVVAIAVGPRCCCRSTPPPSCSPRWRSPSPAAPRRRRCCSR
jgi:hypothetical protein